MGERHLWIATVVSLSGTHGVGSVSTEAEARATPSSLGENEVERVTQGEGDGLMSVRLREESSHITNGDESLNLG